MAIQLLSQITATVTTPIDGDLMLIENSSAHKKITFLSLKTALTPGNDTELVFNNNGVLGTDAKFKIFADTYIQAGTDNSSRVIMGQGLVGLYNGLNINTIVFSGNLNGGGNININNNAGASRVILNADDSGQYNIRCGGKTSIELPSGTSAERPTLPQPGAIRLNTDLGKLEVYLGATAEWETITST